MWTMKNEHWVHRRRSLILHLASRTPGETGQKVDDSFSRELVWRSWCQFVPSFLVFWEGRAVQRIELDLWINPYNLSIINSNKTNPKVSISPPNTCNFHGNGQFLFSSLWPFQRRPFLSTGGESIQKSLMIFFIPAVCKTQAANGMRFVLPCNTRLTYTRKLLELVMESWSEVKCFPLNHQ